MASLGTPTPRGGGRRRGSALPPGPRSAGPSDRATATGGTWLARRAASAAPLFPGIAERTLAYAAGVRDDPDEELRLLALAEASARARGQRIDEAIAAHRRGHLLGGAQRASLREDARRTLVSCGTHERLLAEWPRGG
jgi:hypothetical protein